MHALIRVDLGFGQKSAFEFVESEIAVGRGKDLRM